ncbi:hypothetical protein [Arthrobacter sp. A2-55]|uniref:hypothetical protein n=1 Tax=Arthrobacter sp. A2-55 TaxID=2897337 RepID=UPI0021CDCBF5|nr:hypothetical protein [Arthrobacter sp. A2-55]MCU6481935.1 hypothetical protein [Arthrobacter sp. A2-55]
MKKSVLTSEQLLEHATEFAFLPTGAERGQPDVDLFTVTVSSRSPGRYAVLYKGSCWDGEGWVYESMPSSRTGEFKARTRFPLAEAVGLGRAFADTVTINGHTWAQWQERLAANREGAN